MKLRPVQLVCLALLLATLRLADPAALAPDDFALRAGVLNVFLHSELAEIQAEATPRLRPVRGIPVPAVRPGRLMKPLFAAQISELRNRWTMAPPADQSAAVQSCTSFLRA